MYKCENDHTIFESAAPSVGMFLLDENNSVLLSVRGIEPHKGMLDAFGGFVDTEETPLVALHREMEEELGLSESDYSEPIYLTTTVGHYPYENETHTVLSAIYYARLNPGVTPVPADDVAEIKTVDASTFDLTQLHDDDVREGFKKLQEVLAATR
jgi:ADP-ribose pyrophosphatase YjhB (NUDIX family)